MRRVSLADRTVGRFAEAGPRRKVPVVSDVVVRFEPHRTMPDFVHTT